MSERLTNSKRDAIVETLLDRGFSERFVQLAVRGKALLERMAVAAWEGHYNTIKKLPAELFPSVISISFYAGEVQGTLELEHPLPVPRKFLHFYYKPQVDEAHFPADPSLGDDFRAFVAEFNSTHADRKRTKNEIEGVVYSVNTYKKLYEVWPELKTVLPAAEPIGNQQLAPHLPALNATLGLPA